MSLPKSHPEYIFRTYPALLRMSEHKGVVKSKMQNKTGFCG